MPRTYQPRPKKTYTEITVENALAEHKEFGTSVRALAEKPKVPKSTLQRRLNNGHAKKVGCKPVFTPNQVFFLFVRYINLFHAYVLHAETSQWFQTNINWLVSIRTEH